MTHFVRVWDPVKPPGSNSSVTLNEPVRTIQEKPEDVIGSHQNTNSGDAVDKVLNIRESDGSFNVQVQFKNAAASRPSPTSAKQRSAHLSFQAFLHLPEPNVRLNTSLRSQAIRAQLMVIEVKGQEPFHSGQGLVMVTALVSSEADGAQLMRLQWHDYRVLLGA
jgi:hypothetical protein